MKTGFVALATLALAAPAAAAENPFAQDQAILTLSGLDLSTAEGQQRLAIRIDNAARAVCGSDLATLHLAADSKARECRAAVVADVRAQIEARSAKLGDRAPVRLASLR